MSKKKAQDEQEQLDLIDIRPENAKEILCAAKTYKKLQKIRLDALAKEVKEKQKVLAEVKRANLKPLDDGTIKFTIDRIVICIKPRDELITVKYDETD